MKKIKNRQHNKGQRMIISTATEKTINSRLTRCNDRKGKSVKKIEKFGVTI